MTLFNIRQRSPHHLSIFLGSPSDLTEERNAAREVVTELLDHPLLKGKISIGLVTWTRESPLEGNADPQQAVLKYVGRPSECNLTVILLSGRLGTPFGPLKPDGSPYRSGTEWEFEDARRANKPVFLYVRRNPRDPQTAEEREQRTALADFLAGLKDAGLARNDYDSVEDFRALFREHVLRFVSRHMEPASRLRPAAWAGMTAIAVAVAIYAVLPGHPMLSVDSVDIKHVTSDPGEPQQIRLVLKTTIADGKQGDQCLVQASESKSFATPYRDVLGDSGTVEDGMACEPGKVDFLFQLAERPHIDIWRGWVRIALRRGDRIFESKPVAVEATTKGEALSGARKGATR
jgi:hypothetical protein